MCISFDTSLLLSLKPAYETDLNVSFEVVKFGVMSLQGIRRGSRYRGIITTSTICSLLVPFFHPSASTAAFSVDTSANLNRGVNISQARFLCEAGLTGNNISILNKSFESAGKSWCSRLASQLHKAIMGKDKWLGKTDPSSFSNPEDFLTESIHLQWNVDFSKKSLQGLAQLNLKVLNSKANELLLDTRDLQIERILSNGTNLPFKVGATVSSFGEPLSIQVSDIAQSIGNGGKLSVEIHYSTTEKCSGLQWLNPLQTAGKKHPYVFSQCQAIHARSLLPCQDTPYVKASYTAEVTTPKDLQALMSAVPVGSPRLDGNNKVYQFEQKIPIPSYLTAIAVGDIVGKEIGPRSRVWTEKEFLDASAFEFSDTEKMVSAAEKLLGKYVWGQYDILVLPPSFPYGGMENPCLTFATPTLLAGDKSLANVIAHEIAHSWTGNLVTNKDWEHFWLNEGFTVFVERKILAALDGEKLRQFASIGGWDELAEHVKEVKEDNPFTRLVVDLNGTDPDDAFSKVPYEKGYAFLYYLEQKVGGASVFEPFLAQYIQLHSFKSIDSNVFKAFFISYFEGKGLGSQIADIDWDRWFFTPGMPPVKNEYDHSLNDACTALKKRWIEWTLSESVPFEKSDLDSLLSEQRVQFLQLLLQGDALPLDKVLAMEKAYQMNGRTNSEIRFRWLRVCIRAKYKDIVPLALKFVNEQGRMKFVRPIYRELYAWEEVRPKAIQNYHENSKYMMHVLAKMLLQDLHIKP